MCIRFSFFIPHTFFSIMPFNLTTFKKTLKSAFSQIETTQSEALAVEIAANFLAGQTAAEKHKSIKSEDPPEEEGLTDEEKAEIAALVALNLGYISEFNDRAQAQILAKVQALIEIGGSQDEIQSYVDDVFEGNENIIIDNTDKIRKEIYVDKDMNLSTVDKTITKSYSTTIDNYAQLLGERASHASYETGRKLYNINNGYQDWVFTGPADERARPWHVALLGEVFTWGTERSNYAEQCLNEHHCRHRSNTYYGDSRDVPAETWQKLKDDAGLHWDDNKQQWALKYKEVVPKTEKQRTPAEVQKLIKDHEAGIKDKTTEKALIFDKNGNLLFEKEGIEDKVKFKGDEIKFFKGNIVTHNHPGSEASLSSSDIKQACLNGSNEIRAVSAKRIFSMKMKDGSDFTPELWNEIISREHEKIFNELIAEYRPMVQRGDVKIENAAYLVSHFTWVKVAKNVPEIEYKVFRW